MTALESYKKYLNEGVCNVVFLKKNGAQRTMRCTTKTQLIPEAERPVGSPSNWSKVAEPSVINAFDLDINEWRSFCVDKVESFTASV